MARGGWWFATEVEIFFEESQVFRPDVAGWRLERLAEPPAEVPITVRPDWICEILSKNKRNDLGGRDAKESTAFVRAGGADRVERDVRDRGAHHGCRRHDVEAGVAEASR